MICTSVAQRVQDERVQLGDASNQCYPGLCTPPGLGQAVRAFALGRCLGRSPTSGSRSFQRGISTRLGSGHVPERVERGLGNWVIACGVFVRRRPGVATSVHIPGPFATPLAS
jgi:hypothetical protein